MRNPDGLGGIAARTAVCRELLRPGEKVIVGLSGGADSIALTHWLHFTFGAKVTACHLNHCLRGEESERDEEFVRALCAEWKLPLEVRRENVAEYAAKHGLSGEEAGRRLRYDFFAQICAAQDIRRIATAHTLSDNAETLIFNLARGAGSRGLCGIPALRFMGENMIIRPLIDCTREQVEAYCAENGLPFVTDSTNLTDDYTRNRIRHQIMPLLRELNPAAETALHRASETAANQLDFLSSQVWKTRSVCEAGDGLAVSELLILPKALRHVLLEEWLRERGVPVTFRRLAELDEILQRGKGCICTAPGEYLTVERGVLTHGAPQEEGFFQLELSPGGCVSLFGRTYCCEVQNCEETGQFQTQKVYRNLLYLTLDYDKIKGKMFLRQRLPGDRISIAGRNGTKLLKKLFIDDKLTALQKSRLPVLADEKGLCAVWGYGPDRRCAVSESTCRLLRIFCGEASTEKD